MAGGEVGAVGEGEGRLVEGLCYGGNGVGGGVGSAVGGGGRCGDGGVVAAERRMGCCECSPVWSRREIGDMLVGP